MEESSINNAPEQSQQEAEKGKVPAEKVHAASFFDRWVERACDVFVARPLRTYLVVVSFMLALVILTALTGNLENSEDYSNAWTITSDEYVEHIDILDDLHDRTDTLSSAMNQSTREVALSDPTLIVAYEGGKDEDIFTSDQLQRMCLAEQKWFGDASYPDFCPLDGSGGGGSPACAAPGSSVVALFYGSNATEGWARDPARGGCPRLDDAAVAATAAALYGSLNTTAGLQAYGFFVGSDFLEAGFTARARSLLKVGGPLAGATVTLEEDPDDEAQEKAYAGFFTSVEEGLFDLLGMEGGFLFSIYRSDSSIDGELGVLWYSWILSTNVFSELVDTDMLMTVCSILFVLIWMIVHIDSFLIAGLGMLQIFLSLPVGRFFYSVVGTVEYFSTLQSLAIFLVLGIGADDIFVLVDAWKQSAGTLPRAPGESEGLWLRRRLASAYGRTMQAVFNTSFTTAMAFISTAASPIMPISCFGIYATICIIVNYLLVITLTPPTLVLHHRYFGGFGPKGCCNLKGCCRALCGRPPSGNGGDDDDGARAGEPGSPSQAVELAVIGHEESKGGGDAPPPVSATDEGMAAVAAGETAVEMDWFTRRLISMFEYEWAACGRIKVVSLALVLGCGAVAVFLAVHAATLTLPDEPEQWFPEDHMIQRFFNSAGDYLQSENAAYPTMSLVWGATGELKRSKFDPWRPDDNRGTAQLDGSFDVTDPAALTAIADGCEALRTQACKSKGCGALETLVRPGTVICAIEEFEEWHLAQFNASVWDRDATGSGLLTDRLLAFRTDTAPADHPTTSWQDLIGVIDGEVRYISVEAKMTITEEAPNSWRSEVLEICERLVKNLDTPATARTVIMVSSLWDWYATQNALLEGMLGGLAIAFPVAFVTLIAATQNILVALYAIFTIGSIVMSVLGCAALNGWSLGAAESIAAVIVVGFAVDYTIHLGHMYDHAGAHGGVEGRTERARYALTTMGSTVLAGAITTCGSGVFMFACQLVFFNKMAFLICVTIAFSLVYSIFFFMPLLYLIGPSGSYGNVGAIFRSIALMAGFNGNLGANAMTNEEEDAERRISKENLDV